MKIPDAEHAVISREKLRDYLLNSEHRRGGAKARLLISLGYQRESWQVLDKDLRAQHLWLRMWLNPSKLSMGFGMKSSRP